MLEKSIWPPWKFLVPDVQVGILRMFRSFVVLLAREVVYGQSSTSYNCRNTDVTPLLHLLSIVMFVGCGEEASEDR
jgi:hypothetical protein